MNEKQDDNHGYRDRDRKIHVTVLYTSTAEDKQFVAEPERTVRDVVGEAYGKLGEERRDGDQYYCHADPRVDLAPHMDTRLEDLNLQGVCLTQSNHGKTEFDFDIDVVPGGA